MNEQERQSSQAQAPTQASSRPAPRVPAVVMVCASVVFSPATVATASPAMEFECPGCQVLDQEELAARRGGFEFAGLKFEFGANIRSYIDNRLVLESLISITSDGTTRQQVTNLPSSVVASTPDSGGTPSPAPAGLQMPAQDSSTPAPTVLQVPAQGSGAPATVQSNAAAAAVPATVDLSGLAGAMGVSVNDRKGFTAALHQATRERIAGIIVNTASGRDIRQELEVRVDVSNFKQFQQSARQAILNSRFGSSVIK